MTLYSSRGLVDINDLTEELDTEEKQRVAEIHMLLHESLLHNIRPSNSSKFALEKAKLRSTGPVSLSVFLYLCGFYTMCLNSVSRQSSPRSKYSPSPPMTLMTGQSLPQSFASSVMILSHSTDLAGLAHRKNSLTLHCLLT